MQSWYYYDLSAKRIGPVSSQEVRTLVFQGIILPGTQMETDTGKQVVAK